MGALTNIQTPVPAARFGPHAPLRVPGTKSGRPDGLAAHRGLLDGLITHFPVTRRVAGDESFDAMARRFIATDDRARRPDFLAGRRFRAFSEARAKPHRLNMSPTSRALDRSQRRDRHSRTSAHRTA